MSQFDDWEFKGIGKKVENPSTPSEVTEEIKKEIVEAAPQLIKQKETPKTSASDEFATPETLWGSGKKNTGIKKDAEPKLIKIPPPVSTLPPCPECGEGLEVKNNYLYCSKCDKWYEFQ